MILPSRSNNLTNPPVLILLHSKLFLVNYNYRTQNFLYSLHCSVSLHSSANCNYRTHTYISYSFLHYSFWGALNSFRLLRILINNLRYRMYKINIRLYLRFHFRLPFLRLTHSSLYTHHYRLCILLNYYSCLLLLLIYSNFQTHAFLYSLHCFLSSHSRVNCTQRMQNLLYSLRCPVSLHS